MNYFWNIFQDEQSFPKGLLRRSLDSSGDFFGNSTSGNSWDNHNSGSGQRAETGQDTYEFVAFVLWYLFLVLCCVVPTCCAYRRRRLVEARLAQQQYDLHRLQQQQPNFLILDQLSSARHHSEPYRRAKTDLLVQELNRTTMTLEEGHFVEETNEAQEGKPSSKAEAVASDVEQPIGENLEDLYGDDAPRVRLLPGAPNAGRTVPGFCAICLCPYETNDKISWSPETSCQHAFHSDCIVPWLAKKEEPRCPVCRQIYCQAAQISEEALTRMFQPRQDMFMDSFALALDYARSQAATRAWASPPSVPNQQSTASPGDVEEQGNDAGEEVEMTTTAASEQGVAAAAVPVTDTIATEAIATAPPSDQDDSTPSQTPAEEAPANSTERTEGETGGT